RYFARSAPRQSQGRVRYCGPRAAVRDHFARRAAPMQSQTEIRALLEERGLRPRRHLGQHFLVDHNLLKRLVGAAAVAPGDLVLEVGPGTGTLTEALVEAGAEVVTVEIDPGLAQIVRERLGAKVTLVEGDALAKGRHLGPDVVAALGGRPF